MARHFVVTLAVLSIILATPQPALADSDYFGTGQWSSSSLTYYFYGPDPDYQSPTQAAATSWNNQTDLTVQATSQDNEKIGVFTGQYGSGAFIARAVICDQSGCFSYDQTYVYAEIDYNTDEMDGFSWGNMNKVALHEFGHTFSLAHTFTCSPAHVMYAWFGSCQAGSLHQHDIDAVNARY